MKRRVTKSQIEANRDDDNVRVLSRRKPAERPVEKKSSGLDLVALGKIFIEGQNIIVQAIQSMKPPTVVVTDVEVPERPKPTKVVISNIQRNNQNRIESVEMDVHYDD